MKNYKATYHHYSIIKLFFIVVALFSFGGYTNYTPPKTKLDTTELVITTAKDEPHTFQFQDIWQNKIGSTAFLNKQSTFLKFTSIRHSELTEHTIKRSSICFIRPPYQNILTFLNIVYFTEDDSFHSSLG